MRLKPGVQLATLTPQSVMAALVVDGCYRRMGYEATLTSGSDGIHHGQPVAGDLLDPHLVGKALDFRIHDIRPGDVLQVVASIREDLTTEYVVFWEGQGTQNEHIHVQYGHVT